MKHSSEHTDYLLSLASSAGLDLERPKAESLLTYLDLLLLKNKETNLTRITDYKEAIRLHIVDSLTPLPYLEMTPNTFFADLGTGGGLPGIPLSLVSGAHGVLVDSVKKKAQAVEEFICTLGLEDSLCIYAGRSEELATTEHAGSFDLVIARALSSLPSLLELAAPLLTQQGVLASMKGAPEPKEVHSAEKVAELLGYELLSVDTLNLPGGEEKRVLYRYRKIYDSSIALPRRTGKAQKTPLA